LPYEVNYYYGIRNNKITKLKKEIDNGFEHARLEKKIKIYQMNLNNIKFASMTA